MSVSSHLRPVALPLSSLQLRLQSLHVRPVDVRPAALTLVSSANVIKNLHCKQVAVTACTNRGICWSVLQLKANVNGECKCRTLHERPVASSTCPLPIPKRTCSGCGTIQAMLSLCPTKSMQVSSHVVCS